MPKILRARPPRDDGEERKIRKLPGPAMPRADWIERARIITLSWDGLGVLAIAAGLGCYPTAAMASENLFLWHSTRIWYLSTLAGTMYPWR